MSTAIPKNDASLAEMGTKLAFTKKLQAVTNKIHATRHIDEIILEVSEEIRNLFEAERLTLYVVREDKNFIVSKVTTGLNEIKELKLAINPQSIAGFVAHQRAMLNIADVYDEAELVKTLDLLPLDRRLEGEVEGLQGLDHREPR